MRGRSSNSQRENCAYGGAPKPRNIGGIKAMPYGHSSNVMKEANGETTGMVGEDGIGVDGVPVRSGLGRKGRKNGGKTAKSGKSKDDDEDGGEHGEYASGGALTTDARDKIADKNFALPGRRYPIEDIAHARNALARVSQNGTAEEKEKVRAAVHRKYPSIGKGD